MGITAKLQWKAVPRRLDLPRLGRCRAAGMAIKTANTDLRDRWHGPASSVGHPHRAPTIQEMKECSAT